jgi:hypothetical protein
MKRGSYPDLMRLCAAVASVGLCLAGIPESALGQGGRAVGISPEKRAAVEELIEVTGLADLALQGMEANLPAQKLAMPHIPDISWEELQARLRADIGAFVEMVVPIYRKHFTLGEIQDLIAFYRTPLGQRVLEVQPLIMAESARAGQAWGAQVGYQVELDLAKRGIKIQQQ